PERRQVKRPVSSIPSTISLSFGRHQRGRKRRGMIRTSVVAVLLGSMSRACHVAHYLCDGAEEVSPGVPTWMVVLTRSWRALRGPRVSAVSALSRARTLPVRSRSSPVFQGSRHVGLTPVPALQRTGLRWVRVTLAATARGGRPRSFVDPALPPP